MNNEIGRKITSLTIMTIMIAGGMTFAVPGVMPAAYAANANLFVSAENSQFDNYMSGPQVIEVVIIDSDINDTDEAKGEPDVTVNGKILRMVQAVDGNWYGYFADDKMAATADATTTVAGQGLDFGSICSRTVADDAISQTGDPQFFSDTQRVATNEGTCGAGDFDSSNMNVLREAKAINENVPGASNDGQIGVDPDAWPFIQLYQLNPTGNVIIQYNKGGGAQTTTLTFDTVDQFAGLELDKSAYGQGDEVHATITDLWLNIDPTDEDSWTFGTTGGNKTASPSTHYQVFDENGAQAGDAVVGGVINIASKLGALMCEDNCVLVTDIDAQDIGTKVITLRDNDDSEIVNVGALKNAFDWQTLGGNLLGNVPVTITEQGPNSGVFGTYDESDDSTINITVDAKRGTSASIDYNETPVTVLIGFEFGSIDIQPIDDEWSSGEEIPVVLIDGDANLNSRADEDLDFNNPNVALIPSLKTGTPTTMFEVGNLTGTIFDTSGSGDDLVVSEIQLFSQRALVVSSSGTVEDGEYFNLTRSDSVSDLFNAAPVNDLEFLGFALLNYDFRSLANDGNLDTLDSIDLNFTNGIDNVQIGDDVDLQGLILFDDTTDGDDDAPFHHFGAWDPDDPLTLIVTLNLSGPSSIPSGTVLPMAADIFGFGFIDDGVQSGERVANQIIRLELEETGDNTSTFEGSLEYTMVNQLNILDPDTYTGLSTIADDPSFIVIEDLTDEDSPRVNYADLGADGTILPIADQEEAPSHSGVVSFDNDSYKVADTVTITLEDADLNVDSDLIDIFTVVTVDGDPAEDAVGKADLATSEDFSFGPLGRLLDVTYDDQLWTTPTPGTCFDGAGSSLESLTVDTGLGATGFSLVETGIASGIFKGDFAVPAVWCEPDSDDVIGTTGLDIEVNYVDFRDASGEIIEVGDSAGIRANTGSVSLDRTVYPVPFGVPANFGGASGDTSPDNRSIFPIHATGFDDDDPTHDDLDDKGTFLANGELTVHIRVNDPDFDISPDGEDVIAQANIEDGAGPVKLSVLRGADSIILGYAGGPDEISGPLIAGTDFDDVDDTNQFGPITEIAPDAGIFEIDIGIAYTHGPESSICPDTVDYDLTTPGVQGPEDIFVDEAGVPVATSGKYCILQGDILQVEYTDPADASGDVNTVTDSATFDLRNGVLQSDKSVYIIGSDMILTLIEPDFDLDNDGAETYDLDLIEWDSDAATVTMGNLGDPSGAFDPEPSDFRETGDSTGIFQIVIEIPDELDGDKLERGEEIILEYTDWGPSGSDFVGDEDEDVNLTIYTSNFGATVELDQKVYTWTDKVYITIVAPDHNFDSDLVDEIGNTDLDPIKVATRGDDIDNYKLVETGTDTGIFTGEVILTGFTHDADGDSRTGDDSGNDVKSRPSSGNGPTDGLLSADDDDGITVSFEFSEDETVVGSALIRWNIGEVQWLEASYPATGTGVVRVIDPDMNLNPEAVNNFNVDVWSDSDAGGIDLTVTETNEATGIFEGTVFFTVTDESSGHRLRVAEGDTVTAEYEDNTLPDPYTTADELDITATSLIGTVVPPLERAPASNCRVVDAFGNTLSSVSVDQQVQLTCDVANGQDREQAFAYLMQIQDANGVTISLAWITGSLSPGQSFSPALSWIPTSAGTFDGTAFVWESVDNPTALSPPNSFAITVN